MPQLSNTTVYQDLSKNFTLTLDRQLPDEQYAGTFTATVPDGTGNFVPITVPISLFITLNNAASTATPSIPNNQFDFQFAGSAFYSYLANQLPTNEFVAGIGNGVFTTPAANQIFPTFPNQLYVAFSFPERATGVLQQVSTVFYLQGGVLPTSSNTIITSAVDNEVYLVAVNTNAGSSYQLAHIQSGNSKSVNVTTNIYASPAESLGVYFEPPTLNGVNNNLTATQNVFLPSGTYNIVAVGINWGGPWDFSVKINERDPVTDSNNNGKVGVVWPSQPGVIGQITV